MKLLTQSDDYGFTRGVTCGILDAIENGVVRNTGLFVNMPESEHAASFIQDYPQVCFGIDFNIVSEIRSLTRNCSRTWWIRTDILSVPPSKWQIRALVRKSCGPTNRC